MHETPAITILNTAVATNRAVWSMRVVQATAKSMLTWQDLNIDAFMLLELIILRSNKVCWPGNLNEIEFPLKFLHPLIKNPIGKSK